MKHFLPIGDTCGINLQRDVWGLKVEREAASVDVQCLHFAPMVRAELLSDFLQEAGREQTRSGTILPRPQNAAPWYGGGTEMGRLGVSGATAAETKTSTAG